MGERLNDITTIYEPCGIPWICIKERVVSMRSTASIWSLVKGPIFNIPIDLMLESRTEGFGENFA